MIYKMSNGKLRRRAYSTALNKMGFESPFYTHSVREVNILKAFKICGGYYNWYEKRLDMERQMLLQLAKRRCNNV